ncbi:hypothetical protein IFM89_025018 [Coptis chinensis]|uniref:DNA/RNA-binding protein Alba-like domain-containing protein n=1 Tax=Coptis chinensis TaxID=261450 RepID=A0A835HSX2_9MAGN|nr:hypothetical protein IFM89_025018 [Coptis chinensis]
METKRPNTPTVNTTTENNKRDEKKQFKPKLKPVIRDNEMRIRKDVTLLDYIESASRYLKNRSKTIVIKAMGVNLCRALDVSEALRGNISGLNQEIATSSDYVVDVWEPVEEGLDPVKTWRRIPVITITLSTTDLNTNSPGYQAPLFVGKPAVVAVAPAVKGK